MKYINWLFRVSLLLKESFNLIRWETQQVTPNQKWQSQMLPSIDDYLHVKKSMITWFFLQILTIKESDWMIYNLIEWDAKLATSNKNR